MVNTTHASNDSHNHDDPPSKYLISTMCRLDPPKTVQYHLSYALTLNCLISSQSSLCEEIQLGCRMVEGQTSYAEANVLVILAETDWVKKKIKNNELSRIGSGEWGKFVAIKATAALGALEEILDAKVSGSYADREEDIFTLTPDLNDVEPEEQDLDGHTLEIVEPTVGDHSCDGGLVVEGVRLYDEAARSFKIHCELPCFSVQRIPYRSLRKKPHRESGHSKALIALESAFKALSTFDLRLRGSYTSNIDEALSAFSFALREFLPSLRHSCAAVVTVE
ncbi:uncharacterized protein HKW66_Vig0247900 [Vigna angularis]|uniref:Uncharacterized protein n=1 Tax=Phaseolus angularis TaxID=3914 RepID=A0A8T0KU11_PHAAN|nr:uncharacterized protein HKW66_Vig0247900 [Vigna angularis]